jgi:hypothetical protein
MYQNQQQQHPQMVSYGAAPPPVYQPVNVYMGAQPYQPGYRPGQPGVVYQQQPQMMSQPPHPQVIYANAPPRPQQVVYQAVQPQQRVVYAPPR